MRPTLDAYAALRIVKAVEVYGPHLECAFRGTWDAERQAVTRADLVARGSRDKIPVIAAQYPHGSVALHTHPAGSSLEPSEADIDCALMLAAKGVGFGIVSPDAEQFYLMIDPAALVFVSHDARAAVDAELARIRRCRWGRLHLQWYPPRRRAS
jgi:hypothetical protein